MFARDILILLSTHNPGPFLSDQLESLRSQTVSARIHLLIRDDGSTDPPLGDLEAMDLSPLSVEIHQGPNLGARDSFTNLISQVPEGYSTIMVCDQDDVWMPGKVELAATRIDEVGRGIPTLYCGRSLITDATLTPLGITDNATRGPSFRNSLFQNIAPGHTMAFNYELALLYTSTINPSAIMHDWWLYCLASGLGQVIFESTPQTYYRLHNANQIGYAHTRTQRLLKGTQGLVSYDRSSLTRQARALMAEIGPQLKAEDHNMLAAFLRQNRFTDRLDFLRRYPLISQRGHPIVSTLLFALGLYRHR